MNISTIIGLIAGLTTTFAFIPQIVKTIQTKDTKSISLSMYCIYTLGTLLWFVYAFMINEYAIVFTNAFSFSFGVIMLILKIRY